jgi:hypothetical protein
VGGRGGGGESIKFRYRKNKNCFMSLFWFQNLEVALRFPENKWAPEILHNDPEYNVQYISLSKQLRCLLFSTDMLLSCNTPDLFNL